MMLDDLCSLLFAAIAAAAAVGHSSAGAAEEGTPGGTTKLDKVLPAKLLAAAPVLPPPFAFGDAAAEGEKAAGYRGGVSAPRPCRWFLRCDGGGS